MNCSSILPACPPCGEVYNQKWPEPEVYLKKASGKPELYTLSAKSGRLFLQKETAEISSIAVWLMPGYAVWGAGSVVFHTLRIPYDFVKNLLEGEFCRAFTSIAENLLNILRDLIFTPLLILAAAYAVIFSREGRELVSMLERNWRHGVTVQEDYRKIEEETFNKNPGISTWKLYSQAARTANVCYLAWCFQDRGDITERKEDIDWQKTTDSKVRDILRDNFNLVPPEALQ